MRTKLVLGLALLAACHSDSDSDPVPAPQPVAFNTGTAVDSQFGSGHARLFLASEEGQGRDLTGDGDLEDDVWQLLVHFPPAVLGGVVNTGLARAPRRIPRDEIPGGDGNERFAVFRVSETATGSDADEDGTPDEISTWIFDHLTGHLEGLPFAHASHALGGDLAAFLVAPPGGTDLELHVYDARDQSLTTVPGEPSALFAAGGGIVAFARAEEGAFDLNADGDSTDGLVVHLYDADRHHVLNTSLATYTSVSLRAGFAGIKVSEELNGGLDLDGDGDGTDFLFVAVEGRSGLLRVPGIPAADLLDLRDPVLDRFLLGVPDDIGGPGSPVILYDPVADRKDDTGLSASIPDVHLAGRWLGVTEFDPRTHSHFPRVHDTLTGRNHDLGFPGIFLDALDGQILGIDLSSGSGAEFFAWDPRAGTLRFPGLLLVDVTRVEGDAALLLVAESDTDRNGDGDAADTVLARYDARTRTVAYLRLATTQAVSGALGRASVLVSEPAQGGTDLNGDGDAADSVLHQVLLDPPRG